MTEELLKQTEIDEISLEVLLCEFQEVLII